MRLAPGRNSRKNPSCFAPSSTEMKLTPVTLPPGRLRFATRPSLTGSPPTTKTMGTVVVAALAARAAGVLPTIRGYLPAKKVRDQKRQSVSLTLGRAVFDQDVLALDIASLLHALVERGHPVKRREWVVSEKPDHRHRRLLRTRRKRPRRRAAERG